MRRAGLGMKRTVVTSSLFFGGHRVRRLKKILGNEFVCAEYEYRCPDYSLFMCSGTRKGLRGRAEGFGLLLRLVFGAIWVHYEMRENRISFLTLGL